MRDYRRPLVFTIACLVLCAGCGRGVDHVRTDHFSAVGPARVNTLLVAIDAHAEFERTGEETRTAVRRATGGRAQTLLLDLAEARETGSERSERATRQAIDAARSEGAEAVAVVEVDDCMREFHVPLLPPGWGLQSTLRYTVRVYDVATGAPILSSARFRRDGGLYAVRLPDVRRQLEAGLRDDLAPLLAPREKSSP